MNAPPSNASGFALRPVTWSRSESNQELDRSATVALRKVVGGADTASGTSSASWNPYQAALALASSTRQVIPTAGPARVSSRTIAPAASMPYSRKRAAALECTGGVTIAAGVAAPDPHFGGRRTRDQHCYRGGRYRSTGRSPRLTMRSSPSAVAGVGVVFQGAVVARADVDRGPGLGCVCDLPDHVH